MSSESEITICGNCKGRGVTDHEVCTSYHNRDYDYWTETCTRCLGSGLMKVVTETLVTVTPYTPEKEDRRPK